TRQAQLGGVLRQNSLDQSFLGGGDTAGLVNKPQGRRGSTTKAGATTIGKRSLPCPSSSGSGSGGAAVAGMGAAGLASGGVGMGVSSGAGVG
ncbi:unnamed protein product, partial [Discosporangium mesarthrocarpum]